MTPTSVPVGQAFMPAEFVGGTFTSSLPHANEPVEQASQQHRAETHHGSHAVPRRSSLHKAEQECFADTHISS